MGVTVPSLARSRLEHSDLTWFRWARLRLRRVAYRLRTFGYNVYIMPKHGVATVSQLVTRHRDALARIRATGCGRVAMYGGRPGRSRGLLWRPPGRIVGGVACENSPAILTEPEYRRSLLHDSGLWTKAARRRRWLLPLLGPLVRVFPRLPIPIAAYLPWTDLIDSRLGPREREERLVREGYLQDPDFDRWYPLSAVMSLLTTPPPGRVEELMVPLMFTVAKDGPTPAYVESLFDHLPSHPKKLVRVDSSVSTGCCLIPRMRPWRCRTGSRGCHRQDRPGSQTQYCRVVIIPISAW